MKVEFEKIIRPFVADSPLSRQAVARRTNTTPDEDATLTWGTTQAFEFKELTQGIEVITDDNPNDDEPVEGQAERYLDFTEFSRETEDVRVENPNDAEQYVIVKRITEIVFRGPPEGAHLETQTFWRFTINGWD